MHWIDSFYSPLPSWVMTVGLLAIVCFMTWQKTGRRFALGICIVLFTRYMIWRALYTLNLDDGLTIGISLTVYLAEAYGYVQLLLFSYQAWSPTERTSPPIETHPSVDIMVTVVDEPLYILKRTLIACLSLDYPKDLLEIYVLDDGGRPEVSSLAAELGVTYRSREDRSHAKAGNLNEGLKRSSGEVIVVFDVDHVPMSNFLTKTVGFFADENVAIVQTAQDFYNPDIFQRSVAPGRNLYNEQALFFRTLQAGRDHHNSAFFAGSSGLIRRSALEEIGGFQTATITEDLHTSLMLHAKGYKSYYLNETLAFGLMPETFEDYTKQRARWATGTAQVLVRDNPFFKRGLSWAQRVDYFGAIHYFFFGFPRIVFLIAPISWLVFSIPAIRAETGALINYFFSAYAASILAIQMISRNTRSAFWSDVHETVMSFAVARASLVGLFSARSDPEFEITPKGGRSDAQSFASASAVGWHVGLFGLLIFGISNGVRQGLGPDPTPGLGISLWWASFNVILLMAAIMPARAQRQVRNFIRHVRSLPCLILDGSEQTEAKILDVSESGVALWIAAPRYALQKNIHIAFGADGDEPLTLKGTVVRQELEPSGGATLGVQFEDLDEPSTQALIRRSFSSPDPQSDKTISGTGVIGSAGSLISVLSRLRERLQPSRRRTPRLPFTKECQLQFDGGVIPGQTQDVSFAGVTAVFPGSHAVRSQVCSLTIEDVELTVSPIESVEQGDETLVRFRIETISKGEPKWREWHQPSSR
ncbi:MAG: glycosyltransferase [Deltaproteobacteria bacterium]|nr:glycosyltransferase [Deltaproteobacteria bacterium]